MLTEFFTNLFFPNIKKEMNKLKKDNKRLRKKFKKLNSKKKSSGSSTVENLLTNAKDASVILNNINDTYKSTLKDYFDASQERERKRHREMMSLAQQIIREVKPFIIDKNKDRKHQN